jgi:hypothetical protein
MDFQQLIKLNLNKIYHFFIIIKILKIYQYIYLLILNNSKAQNSLKMHIYYYT